MGNCSFSRAERIRTKKEFQETKQRGAVFKTKRLLFNFAPTSERSRLGVIVTRQVGSAVWRNRVKRWLREAFRQHKEGFPAPLDLVIIPRTSELSYAAILQDLLFFQQWYHEKSRNSAH